MFSTSSKMSGKLINSSKINFKLKREKKSHTSLSINSQVNFKFQLTCIFHNQFLFQLRGVFLDFQ